jgi:hypothetical protein
MAFRGGEKRGSAGGGQDHRGDPVSQHVKGAGLMPCGINSHPTYRSVSSRGDAAEAAFLVRHEETQLSQRFQPVVDAERKLGGKAEAMPHKQVYTLVWEF